MDILELYVEELLAALAEMEVGESRKVLPLPERGKRNLVVSRLRSRGWELGTNYFMATLIHCPETFELLPTFRRPVILRKVGPKVSPGRNIGRLEAMALLEGTVFIDKTAEAKPKRGRPLEHQRIS